MKNRSHGEIELGALLSGLSPSMSKTEFAFGTLPSGTPLPPDVEAVATIRETEGLTLVAPAHQLALVGVPICSGWAQITLSVHSALGAVGLMAAVTTTLAEAGISANPVSGFFHDHLFVPWDRRHDAVAALLRMSGEYRPGDLGSAAQAVRRKITCA